MTDMSQSYSPANYGGGGPADDEINLSLGLDTTGGLAENLFTPAPEGMHRWHVYEVERAYTQAGEVMLNVKCVIVESNVPNAVGQRHLERLVIPGVSRFQNDQESWAKSMKFLRLKLEGITGRPWRENNINLSPKRDLMDKVFIARCYHKQSDPVRQEDGTMKTYINAQLTDWTAPGVPQAAPPAQPSFPGTPTLATTQVQQAPTPSVNLGQAMAAQPAQEPQNVTQTAAYQAAGGPPAQPPQSLEEAAAAMAPPASNPLGNVAVSMTVPQGEQVHQPAQQPSEPAASPGVSLNPAGMTFPTDGPPSSGQAPNGGAAQ